MSNITIYGFHGSTFVRTIRMLLIERGVASYAFIPVNLQEGARKDAAHLARHPFGRVPVVDVDGFRVIETHAIARFLDAVLPGPALVPSRGEERGPHGHAVSILNSYGDEAMVLRVAGYHLFPDFTSSETGLTPFAGRRIVLSQSGRSARAGVSSREDQACPSRALPYCGVTPQYSTIQPEHQPRAEHDKTCGVNG